MKKNQNNKYKSLAQNTVLFGIGTFGSKILSFLLIRFYTDLLDPEEMSTVGIVMQTVFLLIPLASFCVEEAILKFVIGKRDYEVRSQAFTNGFITIFLGNIAFLIVVAPFLNFVADLKGRILLSALCIFMSGYRSINQMFLRATNRIKLFTYDGIQTTFILFMCNIVFMAVFRWGATGYILSNAIADFISGTFMLLVSKSYTYVNFKSVNAKLLRKMLMFSGPLIPTVILWWLVTFSDTYMIRYIAGAEANGLYTAAIKIPAVITIVSTVICQAWRMSAIIEIHSEDSKRFFGVVFNAFQSIMYIAAAGLLLLIKPFTSVLLAEDYFIAYRLTPLLIVGTVLTCFCTFVSAVYNADGKTKHSMWTAFISVAVHIVLNFIFIPMYAAGGAALSGFISYGLCFAIRLYDTRRIINYRVDMYKLVFNLFTISVMCFVIFEEPPLWILFLIVLFLIVLLSNIRELLQTVRKVIGNA
jgi:O-antigen/teichoic acid export membrane protein